MQRTNPSRKVYELCDSGEPTLHKNFVKYIKKAKELGSMCHFNTNETLLTEEIC